MKGTRAKRNVCPGSCVSTGAKFPVAPVESAPMPAKCKYRRPVVLEESQLMISPFVQSTQHAVHVWLSEVNEGFFSFTVRVYSECERHHNKFLARLLI